MTHPQLIEQLPNIRLSREEEQVLAVRARKGHQDSANELAMSVIRQAMLYTERTCRGQIPDDERLSLCYMKLMMCAKRFDPFRKLRFFAFCKAGLRGQMRRYWDTKGAVRNATEILSADSLGGWTGMKTFRKRSVPHPPGLWLQSAPRKQITSEDEPGDSYREEITGEVEPPAMEEIYIRDRWKQIEKLVKHKLSSTQRQVLNMTYAQGLNSPEIGVLMDVSRSRIHAIHREAMKVIRAAIAKDGRLLKE